MQSYASYSRSMRKVNGVDTVFIEAKDCIFELVCATVLHPQRFAKVKPPRHFREGHAGSTPVAISGRNSPCLDHTIDLHVEGLHVCRKALVSTG